MILFFYSSMNAGKTAMLLQYRHNLLKRNRKIVCFSTTDTIISSLVGIKCSAHKLNSKEYISNFDLKNVDCIFVDEAQFMSYEQVKDICYVSDEYKIDIRAYGLRTDFLGRAFEGSSALLSLADRLIEVETSCSMCNSNALMTIRVNEKGYPMTDGAQKIINDRYISVCRKHYFRITKNKKSIVENWNEYII